MDKKIILFSFLFLILPLVFGCEKLSEKKSLPKQQQNPSSLDQVSPPKIENNQSTNARKDSFTFMPEYIEYSLPLRHNKIIYYLKDGDIWMVDTNSGDKELTPFRIIDAERDILTFNIAPDDNYLAYSLRYEISQENASEFPNQQGNTVILRNLKTSEEITLYSSKTSEQPVISIFFSRDGKKIFFSNDSIQSFTLTTKQLQKYITQKPRGICGGLLSIQDISFDGIRILARNLCTEGGNQIILNTKSKKIEAKFNNGYVGGGTTIMGFINNKQFFGYSTDDNYQLKMEIYNNQGRLIKTFPKTFPNLYVEPLIFDNQLGIKSLVIGVPNFTTSSGEKTVIKNVTFYGLDPRMFTLRETTAKQKIITLLRYPHFGGNAIWLTNSNFLNAHLIDDHVESIYSHYVYH